MVLSVDFNRRKYLYLAVATGNILLLCVGLCFGWSSPYVTKLLEEEKLNENPIGRIITKEEESWIGSLLPCGAIFGTFITKNMAMKFGRKITMLFNLAIPLNLMFLALAFANNVYVFYLLRFFSGLIVSGIFYLVPMYTAEIAEDDVRGFLSSSAIAFETFGELLMYCLGPYLTIFATSMTGVVIAFVAAINILVIIPESPYYLISIHNITQAEASLMRLRSSTKDQVAKELQFMQGVIQETEGERAGYIDLFSTKASTRALGIVIGLVVFLHFSGVIPVLLYSQVIFQETGSEIPSQYCTMAVGTVQFIGACVTPHLVDNLGRKAMLFTSAMGTCIAQTFLGLYFFLKNRDVDMSEFYWLPVTCLIFYFISYSTGFGPLIWTVMNEIFPAHLKGIAVAISVSFFWLLAFIMGRVFFPISVAIGMGQCFWIFAGSSFVGMIFICTCVIETKGKNFQDIQAALSS